MGVTGTFIYDLARNPPSFNFVDALLSAEAWRIEKRFDALSIVVMPGPLEGFRRDNLPPSGGAERSRWRDNIVLPMPILLPSCGKPAELVDEKYQCKGPNIGRGEYLIGFGRLVKMAKAGNYPFRVPEEYIARARAKHGSNYITISERNTGWWIERTTNLNEWRIVARELERRGYNVVLIPEGTKADRAVEGFVTDPDAGRNVLDRAGLYAGAVMNFGIPSGPIWLAWFLGVPLIVCKMLIEKESPTSTISYTASGLPPGSQLANARPRQLLLWEEESAANILGAFNKVMA